MATVASSEQVVTEFVRVKSYLTVCGGLLAVSAFHGEK